MGYVLERLTLISPIRSTMLIYIIQYLMVILLPIHVLVVDIKALLNRIWL